MTMFILIINLVLGVFNIFWGIWSKGRYYTSFDAEAQKFMMWVHIGLGIFNLGAVVMMWSLL